MTAFLVEAPTVAIIEAAPPPGTARQRRPLGLIVWIAIVWLVVMTLAAVFADLLPLHDPLDTKAGIPLSKPTANNPLGTDALGRDLLSRTIYGARVSIVVGVSAVLLSTVVGGAIGMVAGLFRKRVGASLLFMADVLLAFPALLLAVSIVAFTDSRGIVTVTLAIALIYLGPTIRIVRALTLQIGHREFVLAARSIGATRWRLITREILPNLLPTVMSLGVVAVAGAMVAEGGLAYLNLSVAPPTPTWGGMMAAGKAKLDESLYPVMVPAGAMFLTVLALTMIGDEIQRRQGRGTGAID